jgi:hypothetical protein
MSKKGDCLRYERATKNIKSDGGSGAHLYHMATFLLCHSTAPPPASEYETWLASAISHDPRGKTKLTGAKLRRVITMRRNGCSIREAGHSVGISAEALSKWLDRLPPELAA